MAASPVRALLVSSLLLLGGCASVSTEYKDELPRCPAFPGCARVTWETGDETGAAWDAVVKYLESRPNVTIVERLPNYVHAEARTERMGFVDDVEILRQPTKIVARSASRIGISDLGKNRQRLRQIEDAMRLLNGFD